MATGLLGRVREAGATAGSCILALREHPGEGNARLTTAVPNMFGLWGIVGERYGIGAWSQPDPDGQSPDVERCMTLPLQRSFGGWRPWADW